jgi:ankyrin repeat protein
MDSIVRLTTSSSVRQKLESFKREAKGPEGPNGPTRDRNSMVLDNAYKDAMDRINGQDSDSRELAIKALSWIVCAKRRLTTRELQHALAVTVGDTELDEDNITEPQEIASVCAGLVTIDQESNIIRLVHYTTQEFFEKHRASLFPRAEVLIVQTCVTYLSFGTFENGHCKAPVQLNRRQWQYALYNYAAAYWAKHDSNALKEAKESILKLLDSDAKVSSCSQVVIGKRRSRYRSRYESSDFTALHLIAYFGLVEIMTVLFTQRQEKTDIEAKDKEHSTPLVWAAREGHVAAVKQLIDKGADIETHSGDSKTPLVCAIDNGHLEVVKLLLDTNADIEARDSYGATPLHCAASHGHEEVVRLLLDYKAAVDSRDDAKSTALSYAAYYGRVAVVKLLLERRAVIESRNRSGQTPLMLAARGHECVVRLLLERGADVHSMDDYSKTALSYAAECGNEAVVNLLLDRKVEIEHKNIEGSTPLSIAASRGHSAVAKPLLNEKAGVESKDLDGSTAPNFGTAGGT